MIKKVSLNSQSNEIKTLRNQLQKDTEAFKKKGGKIQEIPFGISSNPIITVFRSNKDCSAIVSE